ncbi:Anaphase-promoting complex subunit 5 [Choanephora cucurbitarum]|uniref:Anaphase-promoting complex subunit 5 n=1 Tax=Choanephora cucurbitarum TaxID=101091 RepID=A0A1C7NLH4_9FUNG|nr:Anaphase-promoting complex subunit 5 [Choanephora cucurbitarum]
MLHVGYVTPYRVTLLVLLDMFCHYRYTKELASKFVVFLTKSILNKTSFKQTCSEPTLQDIFAEINGFDSSPEIIEYIIHEIKDQLEKIQSPDRFQQFMKLYNDDEEGPTEGALILDKLSVFGIFIRRCRVEYENMSFKQLEDVQRAHTQYLSGLSGDAEFTTGLDPKAEGWVSDYNVKEFLKWQAEKIQKTGTTNIDVKSLHQWLQKIEKDVPDMVNIGQVRYLNYTRTKEYTNSLSCLNASFDLSLVKGVEIQYALLNLGILEHKFGHQWNAISALKDAVSAARANQDEYCLQEIQFWNEICQNGYAFDKRMTYSDKHLSNMKTLILARNMLRDGQSHRDVLKELQKSLTTIIMKDIDFMDRPQFLITSLAWLRYGNSVIGHCYLNLTNNSDDEYSSIEDIEKTAVAEARALYFSGKTDKAIQLLSDFSNRYESESDLLVGWRQAKAYMSRRRGITRTFFQMDEETETSRLVPPSDIDEYFEAIQSLSNKLILEKEFERAECVYDGMQKYAQDTNQRSQVCNSLILKAIYYLHTDSIDSCKATLIRAMRSSRECHDAKTYYYATIKLCELYVCLNNPDLLEKAVYMLESIFPKVLLMKNRLLNTDLHSVYHQALERKKKSLRSAASYQQSRK